MADGSMREHSAAAAAYIYRRHFRGGVSRGECNRADDACHNRELSELVVQRRLPLDPRASSESPLVPSSATAPGIGEPWLSPSARPLRAGICLLALEGARNGSGATERRGLTIAVPVQGTKVCRYN